MQHTAQQQWQRVHEQSTAALQSGQNQISHVYGIGQSQVRHVNQQLQQYTSTLRQKLPTQKTVLKTLLIALPTLALIGAAVYMHRVPETLANQPPILRPEFPSEQTQPPQDSTPSPLPTNPTPPLDYVNKTTFDRVHDRIADHINYLARSLNTNTFQLSKETKTTKALVLCSFITHIVMGYFLFRQMSALAYLSQRLVRVAQPRREEAFRPASSEDWAAINQWVHEREAAAEHKED